jgi:hypothetical protein
MTGDATGRLHVGFSHEPLRVPDAEVYGRHRERLLGEEFTFEVVGQSHRVAAPAVEFHEVASLAAVCDDGNGTVYTLSLSADLGREFAFAGEAFDARTVLTGGPLTAYPADRSFDLRCEFDSGAETAVAVADRGYETYHTYPQRDVTLYSRTTFEAP